MIDRAVQGGHRRTEVDFEAEEAPFWVETRFKRPISSLSDGKTLWSQRSFSVVYDHT